MHKKEKNIVNLENVSKNYKVKLTEDGALNMIKGTFKPKYKSVEAVKNISLKITKGEIVGIVGLNGAGKTTTLKILAGLISPTEGQVEVLGYNPWDKKKEYLRKIGMVAGQRNQLWADLPAMDSFKVQKAIYGISNTEFEKMLESLIELFKVEHLMNIPVRKLSLGEKMKFEVINALLHNPELLLLDEPTIGLDILSQKAMRAFLKEYNEKTNCTTIITSHNMKDIESICKRLVIINKGKITYDGDIKGLRSKYDKKIVFSEVYNNFNIKYGEQRVIDDKTVIYVEEENFTNLMKFITESDNQYYYSVQELDFDDKIEDYITNK
ncbi:ATP-binding cassette domain-containing protein [Clostridiaceae bacterium M8S5]|nr:ATP-binding cassette domain-containing protein [Clostridiaceae bacterium M8S5]